MRSLSGTLTSAQQAASGIPYLSILLQSWDRATSYTVTLAEIISVQESEGKLGGLLSVSDSGNMPLSSIIRIDNSANTYTSVDLRGYKVLIDWGFTTGAGNEYSRSAPQYVVNQGIISTEGHNILELQCCGLLEMLYQRFPMVHTTGIVAWKRSDAFPHDVKHIIMDLIGVAPLVIKSDDGGVFINHLIGTESATGVLSYSTDNRRYSNGTGIISNIPAAIPAINDALYIGYDQTFDRASINVETAGVTYSGVWEYYTGAGWSTLATVTDNTNGLKTQGLKILYFNKLTNWATVSVNGSAALYYIRFRVTSGGGTGATLTNLVIGQDFAVSLDSALATGGEDYQPNYPLQTGDGIAPGSPTSNILADILKFSQLGMYVREDGIHLKYIDTSLGVGSEDYTYEVGGSHPFIIRNDNKHLLLPNVIVVYNTDPRNTAVSYAGLASNAASIAQVGEIFRTIVDSAVASNAEAATQAAIYLNGLVRESIDGQLEAPINVGGEVYDLIKIVDPRTSQTIISRVTQQVKYYTQGIYKSTLYFGGSRYIGEVNPDIS